MPNIAGGGNLVPSVVTDVQTVSRGTSVPSGVRTMTIIGEGAREETLIASAVGGGNDGLNSTFTSTNNSDGRHFQLSTVPVISNRTTLFKNGIPLTLLEGTNNGSSFDDRFDARLQISNGTIELQQAKLVDQGGAFYSANSNNVGNGTINSLTLLDANAPTETWTIRVSSVRRDGYGDPIDGYATFIARGSVSGIIKDGYGNIITWQSNGTTTSNTILQFSVSEGATAFRPGDSFTVQVQSGTLVAGDSLTATYIGETDLNDPEFFTDPVELQTKHGSASTSNTLALGAQIAFANSTPGLFAIQARPAIPRRVSYTLESSASGEADIEDLSFALPLNVVPDADSNINFFVTDAVTGVESQILPNKVDFYDSTYTATPSTFVFGSEVFSYTVILDDSVQKEGNDGVLTSVTGTTATLSSDTVTFDSDDLAATRSVKIFNASVSGNDGVYDIVSVSGGVVTITDPGGFTTESGVEFQVLDSSATSAQVLFTDDLALSLNESLRATVVDTKDADFFDANWTAAYEAAEKIETDMIVPLPSQTKSAIFQAGKQHVETMSDLRNRRERVLLIGGIRGLTPDNVIGNTQAAVEDIGVLEGIQGDDASEILAGDTEDLTNYSVEDAFGDSFRVIYSFPDEIVVTIGASNTKIDGFYISAAVAAFFAANNQVNEPITNKSLAGFTILRDKLYTPLTLENLSAAGIQVLQPVQGGGRVIWGLTTTSSGFPEEEESSVVFIRDRIAKNFRTAFRGFIGAAENPTFQQTLESRAEGLIQSFLSRRLITDVADLKIRRDSVDPRQWNITLTVQPVYPVGWIYIKIGIGTIS